MSKFLIPLIVILLCIDSNAQISPRAKNTGGNLMNYDTKEIFVVSNSTIKSVATTKTTNTLPNKSGTFAMVEDFSSNESIVTTNNLDKIAGSGLSVVNQKLNVNGASLSNIPLSAVTGFVAFVMMDGIWTNQFLTNTIPFVTNFSSPPNITLTLKSDPNQLMMLFGSSSISNIRFSIRNSSGLTESNVVIYWSAKGTL